MSRLDTNTPTVKTRQEYIVIPGTKPATKQRGVQVDGRKLDYGSAKAFKIKDGGLAREIEARHGREGDHSIVVVPIEKRVENGSPRTFLIKLPYKKGFTGENT